MTTTQATNYTYIDNQTLAGVVIALDLNKPGLWSSWVTQTALTTTCMLISVENVRVSPPARHDLTTVVAYAGVPGHYGIIGDALSGTIQGYSPNIATTKAAAKTVTNWIKGNSGTAARVLGSIKADANYDSWIDYEVRNGWPTATILLNGLVDEQFLESISKIVNVPKSELSSVLRDSRDLSKVSSWSKPSYVGQDKEIAKTLFTAGTLIRGRYHDRIAELLGSSIIHHPIREGLLKNLSNVGSNSFKASNTLEYIAKITLAGSMTQRTTPERIRVWAENVATIRKAMLHTRAVTIPIDDVSDDRAIHLAVAAVQECGIRVHSKILDTVIFHALGLGLGGATSFGLSPWLFPAGYIGSTLMTTTVQAGTTRLARSEFRLSRLAHAIPGRLKRV